MSKVHLFELFVGCFVGAITFTASVFAYGKLAAKKWAKTISGAWVKPVQATYLYCNVIVVSTSSQQAT
jgi:NAD(P) transhydrogenase subunit beta